VRQARDEGQLHGGHDVLPVDRHEQLCGVSVDGVKRSEVGLKTVRVGWLLAPGAELVVGEQVDDPRQVLHACAAQHDRRPAQGQGRQNGHAARLVR